MRSATFLLTAALLCAPLVAGTPQAASDRCPVTGQDVQNHRLYHYVDIRNHRYYVRDREAATRLRQCPDCYLRPDGTLLNERPLTVS